MDRVHPKDYFKPGKMYQNQHDHDHYIFVIESNVEVICYIELRKAYPTGQSVYFFRGKPGNANTAFKLVEKKE